MEELLDPIVDRIVNHKDLINQVKQDANKAAKRIEELKETIFNTNNKLDVFE
jgi:peptidoglycan hydrolase CwlO-like protein